MRWRIGSRGRRVDPRVERLDIVANVGGPAGDQLLELARVPGEQRAGGVLVAGEVAPERGHHAVCGFQRFPRGVRTARLAAGVLHQAAQGGRGAAGLPGQPVPMAGQEGHLARSDTEPGAAAGGLWLKPRWREFRHHIGKRSPKVKLKRAAGFVLEHQGLFAAVGVRGGYHSGKLAARDEPNTGEGRDAGD